MSEENKEIVVKETEKKEENIEKTIPSSKPKTVRKSTKWDFHPNPFSEMEAKRSRFSRQPSDFEEKVVQIRRVVKTVKGGRNFKFAALVVVGNKKGKVGIGQAKSKEVPEAIKKAIKKAKLNLVDINITKGSESIAHQIIGKHGSSTVLLKPAKSGSGIIASGVVRAVVELAGIQNIYSKLTCKGNNPQNIVRATLNGLLNIKRPNHYAKLRDKKVSEIRAK